MIEVTPTRTLAVSLLIHAVGIALLLTIRSPEPLRVTYARVTPIALPFHAAPSAAKLPRRLLPQLVRPAPRTFRVPGRVPRPAAPQYSVAVAEPPVIPETPIPEAPILLPAPAPKILELPPAPVRRAPIATGAFGEASVAVLAARVVTSANQPATPPAASASFSTAEILFKPRPAYTDEARRLRIEGEVLLEVLFAASGEARVLRTVRGLGHGLDESAIAAAREIRFRPAHRGDAAVDSSAIVHIVFQVAY